MPETQSSPTAWLDRLDSRRAVPLAVVLLVAAGVGDFVTGADLAFTLAYALPVVLGSWARGRGLGVALTLGATVAGTFTEIAAHDAHRHLVAIIWNQAGACAIYLLIVWAVTMVRRFVDEERRKRALAVSQLRHAERLNVIGTLAAGVAHELGTPLNIILGNAEILEDEKVSRERVRKAAEAIRQQSKRMTAIISHLLEFGRRGGSSREAADLDELVAHAASLLRSTATRSHCEIVYARPSAPVPVDVNASEIEQVLSNLVLNAVQAMPDGGQVRMACTRESARDEQGVETTLAQVTVEDEGSGIAPADLPQIFDPFFTTKGVGKGTGLGLSISYGIVQDHGGSIDVASVLGKGTRFTVRLPLAE
jgi:signal transduction histidine kinase